MADAKHVVNLYYAPGACSLAAHILLEASGLHFKTTRVSVREGFSEELIKLNPKKQVPFLVLEPGVVLTENAAIFTAISQLAPEKKFLGEPGIEVLRSYEWFNFLSSQVHGNKFGVIFRPQRYVNDESLHPMVKEVAVANLRTAFQTIEDKLKDAKPIEAGRLRASDAYLFVFFRWAHGVGIDVQKEYPGYFKRMIELSKLEPVIKATEEEGIPLTGL